CNPQNLTFRTSVTSQGEGKTSKSLGLLCFWTPRPANHQCSHRWGLMLYVETASKSVQLLAQPRNANRLSFAGIEKETKQPYKEED
ncbi:unnamed protein product, partial [Musa textilis]